MCGLAGEVRFDGRRADVEALDRMTACQRHRGPDGDGLWARGPVGLGHRRLSIIDLSEKGAQPMVDPHLGLTVVFNGIVYNYRELRAELQAAGYAASQRTVRRALHRLGYRWKRPRFVLGRPDPDYGRKRGRSPS